MSAPPVVSPETGSASFVYYDPLGDSLSECRRGRLGGVHLGTRRGGPLFTIGVPPIDGFSHSFAVRGIDRAAIRDPSPAEHTWEIAAGAPNVFLTGPEPSTSAFKATFTFYDPTARAVASGAVKSRKETGSAVEWKH